MLGTEAAREQQLCQNCRSSSPAKAARGPRPCRQCGEEFAPTHALQVFCGDDCHRARKAEYQAAYYKRRHPDRRPSGPGTPCRGCGESLPDDTRRKASLCNACRAQRRVRVIDTPVLCHQCGTPFVRTQSFQRYCSAECFKEHYKARAKAYQALRRTVDKLAAMTARAKAAEAAVERVRALAAKWLVFRSCIRERGDAETVRACGRALHTALEAPDAPPGS